MYVCAKPWLFSSVCCHLCIILTLSCDCPVTPQLQTCRGIISSMGHTWVRCPMHKDQSSSQSICCCGCCSLFMPPCSTLSLKKQNISLLNVINIQTYAEDLLNALVTQLLNVRAYCLVGDESCSHFSIILVEQHTISNVTYQLAVGPFIGGFTESFMFDHKMAIWSC